ncbi:MAG: vanadium-dependent haloperoxidase [Bryobacterales bacterium]|nr:vanadium-dependent haloperoxidase [Bryobacterales bacterium]
MLLRAVGSAGIVGTRGGRASIPAHPNDRRDAALKMRMDAAATQAGESALPQLSNGDEVALPAWTACFTKGLPTAQTGEVEPGAYESLLRAIESGKHADFEAIARGSGRRLVNPQAAYAYCLEGGDPHRFGCAPAPAFASPEMAAEMTEMYWLALARDIPFRDYSTSAITMRAAEELKTSARSLFRGPTAGDLEGPYVSQFLVRPVPSGSTAVEQRYRTPLPGIDFMTTYGEWLQIQSGVPPWREYTWDPTPRYIRNGRDLAEWFHYDYLYQVFLNAALILMNYRPESVLFETRSVLSEMNPYKHSKVQDGFVTFGLAQAVDWLGRVTTAALKAAWVQKWLVHRRLRPEAFAGRVHQARSGGITYPVHADLLNSAAVEETFRRHGSYLLPQAYPEGSPLHPSYPGGHATVAGACSIVLKALFDESVLMPDCVHAAVDGLSLEPCPPGFVPTIGAEVNKLVWNVAMGRSWAGIHCRSDSAAGVPLGEDVAISILQDLVRTCTEDFEGFAFTRLDGSKVRINRSGEVS